MADRLSGGNDAIALLANAVATAAALVALILTFGPISGAHFNPAVSIADASQGGLRWGEVPAYVAAQLCGAVLGVWIAHAMANQFGLPVTEYADAAFKASLSPKFSYGCAVFLDADRVNFQKEGFSREELLAGLAMTRRPTA